MLTSTPILDRATPMPAPNSRRLSLWLGGIVTLPVLLLLSPHPTLSAFWCSWFLGIVVHECGHFAGGMLGGMKFNSIRFGPLQIDSPLRLSWHWREALSGVTSMLPREGGVTRGTCLMLSAGGPVASLVSSGLAFWFQSLSSGSSTSWATFGAVSLIFGLTTITPHETSVGDSDGKKIWTILANQDRAARLLALYEISSAIMTVGDFADLPADLIERVTAFNDDSLDTVRAHAIAYAWNFNGPDVARTAGHLETCLAVSACCSAKTRQALMSDAAVFQARKKRRIDLAQAWLDDIPARARRPDLRLRVEASILEAQGNVTGAIAKLSEIEAMIGKFPNVRQREIALRHLAQWKSEISGGDEVRAASIDPGAVSGAAWDRAPQASTGTSES